MSEQNPYELLGVTEEASFDDIQDAKARLAQQYPNDSQIRERLEAAYDAILMDRLKRRQEGKIPVPERIRFPEKVVQTPSSFNPVPVNQAQNWLKGLIDTPSKRDILLPAGIFSVLGAATVFYPSPEGTIVPLALTLGFLANVYLLNRKEKRFGRALLLTVVGLLAGVGVGALVYGVLETSVGFLGSDQLATLVTFFLFWLISSFLR